MADFIKEWFVKIVKSRLFVFWVVMVVICVVVVQHLFQLQIINGEDYLNNYTMSIEKEITTDGTRGNIYDRNGVLLAHNELSYTITLEDSGTYEASGDMTATDVKNETLNEEINTLIDMIEANGDSIVNDLDLYMDENGVLSFLSDGTSLQAFRRDVYGHSSIDELVVNAKLGYDEAKATTEQVYEYLLDQYGVDTDKYSRYRAYQIIVVRYALAQNSYQRYIATDIAQDVSDETVAMIEEHLDELEGVEVSEDTKRVYDYPEYFSHIIGYTGKISTDEYTELSASDDSYTLNDTVGKSGIEQVMELQLQGTKGTETVYVNNVGKILEVKDSTEASAGNDVYLSIDAELQIAVYDLLEQELAGILYSKIINAKEDDSSELYIPIYDVYSALIENSVIDIAAMAEADSGTVQYSVYQTFSAHCQTVYQEVTEALWSDTAYENQSEEMQEYLTYVITWMQDTGLFDTTDVNSSDEMYTDWKNGTVSAKDYLMYAVEASWIQVSALDLDEKYADTDEIYETLISYAMEKIQSITAFEQIIYKYLIYDDQISGTQLCLILFEQGVLEKDAESQSALESGSMSAYTFLKEKINNLEITPAQLALDPCTGSCVIMDPDTGELLACVTYPGYDTNRLANSMDSDYYNQLLADGSLPLYNNATQQATAPGSTFKMVTASAGLTEGVITVDTEIEDTGIFERLDYSLKCWIYPSSHGNENVITALRDSCNTFFCEVGYRLSLVNEVYSESTGLSYLQKYAEMFGLGTSTNIEISEGTSQMATEYPISASIGQSNNKYTTVQLCRYAAAIANEGTVYDLTLLSKVTDSEGETLETYSPTVSNEITELTTSTWSAIKEGMEEVIAEHTQFDDLLVTLAGKTGTAQESEERPNHALFVGYAPADDPEIAIAVRIAYGYGSSNTCDFVNTVMKYYFGEASEEELLNGQAAEVSSSSNSFTD
ncbi:MAG: peptidoglycan glycosyltransferase [Clostridiales bacterium]|nr:peptidoglycan glycosyltransferase [Clostridiales bacterium]